MSSQAATAPRLVTADELFELPDDGHRYDLIRGELRKMSPAGYRHGRSAMRIARPLSNFVEERSLGDVLVAETGFKLARDPDTVLAPDVAFVAADRAPAAGSDAGFAELAPDLVVEVVSPSDRASEVNEKALLWLDAGVRLVWIVDPKQQLVTVYQAAGAVQLIRGDAELDGGDVLPGFRLPLTAIFSDIRKDAG